MRGPALAEDLGGLGYRAELAVPTRRADAFRASELVLAGSAPSCHCGWKRVDRGGR